MICVDDLGDGYPTFPEFQRMLRDYERDLEHVGVAQDKSTERVTRRMDARSEQMQGNEPEHRSRAAVAAETVPPTPYSAFAPLYVGVSRDEPRQWPVWLTKDGAIGQAHSEGELRTALANGWRRGRKPFLYAEGR